jgi:hypothetical protein
VHQCGECSASARAVVVVLLVVMGEGRVWEMPVCVVLVDLSVWIRVEAGAQSCNHVLVLAVATAQLAPKCAVTTVGGDVTLGIVTSFYCPKSVAHFQPIAHNNQDFLFEDISVVVHIIIIIIVTGLESHTRCASRAHVVRLYVP